MSSSNDVRPYGFSPLKNRVSAQHAAERGHVESPDLDAVMAEARSAGQALGFQEGVQRGLDEQRESIARLARMAQTARDDAREYARVLEQEVVRLALAIAEKVVERELKTDHALVVDVVRAAINEVQDATSVHVRVHPDDYGLIEPHWHAIGRNSLGEPIVLVADERVEVGGCLIETAIGHVDGQLSTRFSQVAGQIEALLDGEPS